MQTSVFVSPNTLTIECPINPSSGTTQQKNPFGTQMQLQNRKIIGFEVVSNQDVQYSPISTANPVIPAIVFKNCFLSLYTSSVFDPVSHKLIRPEGLYYDQIPFPIMRRLTNADTTVNNVTSGSRDIYRIRPTEISWTKSYVAIPQSIALAGPCSALLIVHYLDEGDPGTNFM